MKSILTYGFVFSLALSMAQVNIVPFAGVNSTRMYQSYGFQKGGNFGIAGVEIELRKKPKAHRPVYATLVTGVSYLNNGFYQSTNFSFVGASFYTASITDRQMEYIQIPAVLRLNWQPFPLIEDWKIFVGVGISNNLLMSAQIKEKYTSIFISSDILAPPVTEQYEDRRDATDLGQKQSLFTRFEVGMIYKRMQLSIRLSKSITDLYYSGIEKTWVVPAKYSEYLQAKNDDGGITEKYAEITVGYRLGKQ